MAQTATDLDLLRSAVEQRDMGLFAAVFERHRRRLSLVVTLLIDRRIRVRFDAEVVLQDAFAEAWRRAEEFLGDPHVPVFFWLRFLALQRLRQVHQQHMKVLSRDARREVIDALDRREREILVLRHFEQLRNVDAARVLGIAPSASSVRYLRALERLPGVLEATDRDL